jgi:hypothetical protein
MPKRAKISPVFASSGAANTDILRSQVARWTGTKWEPNHVRPARDPHEFRSEPGKSHLTPFSLRPGNLLSRGTRSGESPSFLLTLRVLHGAKGTAANEVQNIRCSHSDDISRRNPQYSRPPKTRNKDYPPNPTITHFLLALPIADVASRATSRPSPLL